MSSSSSSSTVSCCASRRALKIGIIGFGNFAQFLAKTLIKQGHTLRASSRTDHSHVSADLGVTFFRDTGELLEEDNDAIMICTSIVSLSDVLNPSIPFHRLPRPTLFVDVLSVKEHPREALMQGCKMLEISCEDHDKLASRSQFITHTIGRVLSEMNIDSTTIDTKGFQSLLQLKRSTENDSFDLYSGLFIHNKFAMQELKNLELAFEKVKQKLLHSMEREGKIAISGSSK